MRHYVAVLNGILTAAILAVVVAPHLPPAGPLEIVQRDAIQPHFDHDATMNQERK